MAALVKSRKNISGLVIYAKSIILHSQLTVSLLIIGLTDSLNRYQQTAD